MLQDYWIAEWSRAWMRKYKCTFGSGSNPAGVVVFFFVEILSGLTSFSLRFFFKLKSVRNTKIGFRFCLVKLGTL